MSLPKTIDSDEKIHLLVHEMWSMTECSSYSDAERDSEAKEEIDSILKRLKTYFENYIITNDVIEEIVTMEINTNDLYAQNKVLKLVSQYRSLPIDILSKIEIESINYVVFDFLIENGCIFTKDTLIHTLKYMHYEVIEFIKHIKMHYPDLYHHCDMEVVFGKTIMEFLGKYGGNAEYDYKNYIDFIIDNDDSNLSNYEKAKLLIDYKKFY